MTRAEYEYLHLYRDVIALQIRRAMSRDRSALPGLYAEARRLTMAVLRAEVAG